MLSLTMAESLKSAGLEWTPANHDFFMIPYPGLSEQPFVITAVTVILERRKGQMVITFHGTAEWAMDDVLLSEAVWLPREDQVRELLEQRLVGEPVPAIQLAATLDGYQCTIQHRGDSHTFEAFGASDAYGAALLHVMQREG